jgi:hypothetical protein
MSLRLLSLVLRIGLCLGISLALVTPSSAIPAFARKYGLRCTSCHESWPVLNDFGRNFRDNGYQLRLGKDDVITANPGYWPLAVHITPSYKFNTVTNQPTDQGTKTLQSGGIADAAIDLLMAGVLTKDISFLVVPSGFASDGSAALESYWADFSRVIAHSDWFNIRIGKHEVDLPASPHRGISLVEPYLVYGYHPGFSPGGPGEAAGAITNAAGAFDLGSNQLGFEFHGHDRASLTRYNISVFSANDSSGSRHALSSPSIYGHFQKYFRTGSDTLYQYEFGLWGVHATYPTTFLTSAGAPIPGGGGNLEATTRYGLEAQVWLLQAVAPLHLNLVYGRGSDTKELYLNGADRAGTWQGGFLEAIWVPYIELLHWGLFTRYDMIRNQQQPLIASPTDLGDQNQITAGVRYTIAYSNRDEVGFHIEYGTNRQRGVGVDGADVRTSSLFMGVDFLY